MIHAAVKTLLSSSHRHSGGSLTQLRHPVVSISHASCCPYPRGPEVASHRGPELVNTRRGRFLAPVVHAPRAGVRRFRRGAFASSAAQCQCFWPASVGPCLVVCAIITNHPCYALNYTNTRCSYNQLSGRTTSCVVTEPAGFERHSQLSCAIHRANWTLLECCKHAGSRHIPC